jgi:hypothetical protein
MYPRMIHAEPTNACLNPVDWLGPKKRSKTDHQPAVPIRGSVKHLVDLLRVMLTRPQAFSTPATTAVRRSTSATPNPATNPLTPIIYLASCALMRGYYRLKRAESSEAQRKIKPPVITPGALSTDYVELLQ